MYLTRSKAIQLIFTIVKKFLVIQTAFIGDVVLSTAVLEKLYQCYPDAEISILVRKGNETLFTAHPFLHEVLVWNKKEHKLRNLYSLLKTIRKNKYDKVINLQRYVNTGILTAYSHAKETIGFNKNPLSILFSKKIPHVFDKNIVRHEVERNNDLIAHFTNHDFTKPKLYPSPADYEKVKALQHSSYITMTPSSVWFTKQYPAHKWVELMQSIDPSIIIYLLGGKDNISECEQISKNANRNNVCILAGTLSFLQSAALMENAMMNFVNDSAPLHFTSARNAPVTAIFCSTAPVLGYTPLSDRSFIVETKELLSCRPCGFHGHKVCPQGHFKCALTINNEQVLQPLYAN